jgi:hypothetical protein
MCKQLRVLAIAVNIGVALALVAPLVAQQSAAPTKKDPLRFRAFNVSMPTGMSGVTEIIVERWTTPAERQSLLGLVATSKPGRGGQQKLLEALQDVEPRAGYMRTPNSLGWDIKYAYEFKMPDGSRQIVIATDKPVSFAGAMDPGAQDHPFTLIEMRMKPDGEGEGRMLAASSIATKDGRLQLENYGNEPVRLTSITQEDSKK